MKVQKMGSKTNIRWEDLSADIQESVKYMYRYQYLSDIVIHATGAKNGAVMCFSAHKVILAIRSPVFADIISSNSPNGNIIRVEYSPRAIDILLWFMYSDKVETDGIEELIESFEAASAFKVFAFCEICSEKLKDKFDEINPTNVCSILKIANYSKSNELRGMCLRFVRKWPEGVLFSGDFSTLCKKTVCDLLKESKLRKRPRRMLCAILKWMIQDGEKDRQFLSAIDFSEFISDDFLNILKKFPNFFSEQETHDILSTLTLADSPKQVIWNKFSDDDEHNECVSAKSLYESMELIKKCSIKLQTNCTQRFNKYTLYSLSGFEHEILLKVIMRENALKLVMIELAFGSEYVPRDKLDIGLYNNMNSRKKMQPMKYHLTSTLHHHYLLLNCNSLLLSKKTFNLLLVIKVFGLNQWGLDGPVSNQNYRVASVPDCFELKTEDSGLIPVARLKPFQDFLVFIDPERAERKFVLSSFFFDTDDNSKKYLKFIKTGNYETNNQELSNEVVP